MKLISITKINDKIIKQQICQNIINGFDYICKVCEQYESMLNNRNIYYTKLQIDEYMESAIIKYIDKDKRQVTQIYKLMEV